MYGLHWPRLNRGGRRTARAAIVGTVVLGVSAGVLLIGPAQAAYPGSDGRIAFVRAGNVYTIKTDGTGLTKLTTDGHDSGPRWSPHGEQIAFLDNGNLWVMNADGTGKTQITSAAPAFTDSRPSWSPSGRYLAFVKTAANASSGDLMRYDTKTGLFAHFTTTVNPPTLINVTARPAPVAWAKALNAANTPGYFILYEGTGKLCQSGDFCLDALGFGTESGVSNGFPSAEDFTPKPERLTSPDWFPINPSFGTDVLTSVESCTPGCTPSGLKLSITGPTILPGAYNGVYSPDGTKFAYVLVTGGVHQIWVSPTGSISPTLLTTGGQPDWRPVAPF